MLALASGNGITATDARLMELLNNVANGVLTASDAAVQLNQVSSPKTKLDVAIATKADFPEVVWAEGKSAQQVATSMQRISDTQGVGAATRVSPEMAAEVQALLPDCTYNPVARMLVLKSTSTRQLKLPGTVAMIAAGTANPAVVEECRLMLNSMGVYCYKLADSGVMGMHRIVQNLDAVRAADVVVCATGSDGGIASVLAGLVESPVIALPTSTGYGTAFGGVAPLLSALNSSAPGVTVVNIDSGFGASMAAWRILRNASKLKAAIAAAAPN